MGCIDDGQFGKHLFDDIQSGRGVMGWMFGVRYIAWRIMGRMADDRPFAGHLFDEIQSASGVMG